MIRINIVIFCIVVCLIGYTTGAFRRCYQCRSRGVLGDCKDPFRFNDTSFVDGGHSTLATTGVSSVPCSSGWCSKFIEGISGPADEYGTATERACLQYAPNDEEERCAEVQLQNKPTLVCFCRGDLCNPSSSIHSISIINLSICIPISFFLYIYRM